MEGYKVREFDPDKAQAMIKQAKVSGTEIVLLCRTEPNYNLQCAEVIQNLWTEVGLKVRIDQVDEAVEDERLRKGDFHAHVQGHSYRFDPDGFFDRNLHSKSAYGKIRHRWHNERYDQLIEEAKRRELYTEAWNIVHEELPQFHLHELSMVSAASKSVKDYEPCLVSPFTYRQGGIRTAYIG
jgi:peptide/nickel transport system substrate-binding protein